MRQFLLIISLALIASCDVNIAGAGFDDPKIIKELESYEGYISSSIKINSTKNCDSNLSQKFEDIFNDFPRSIARLDKTPVKLSDNQIAQFSDRVFILKNRNGATIIQEKLPQAFSMHPLRVASANLGTQSVIIILNKSRATTHKFFIAIYQENGHILYRDILKSSDVYDIHTDNNNIIIKGACSEFVIKWSNT